MLKDNPTGVLENACDIYIQQLKDQEVKNEKLVELLQNLTQAIDDISFKSKQVYDAKLEFEYTFDALPDLVMILDLDGRIKRANKATQLFLGVEYKEFLGRRCESLFNCSKHSAHSIHDCPRKRAIITLERQEDIVTFKDTHGNDIHFELSCSPVFNSDNELIGTVQVSRNIEHKYEK